VCCYWRDVLLGKSGFDGLSVTGAQMVKRHSRHICQTTSSQSKGMAVIRATSLLVMEARRCATCSRTLHQAHPAITLGSDSLFDSLRWCFLQSDYTSISRLDGDLVAGTQTERDLRSHNNELRHQMQKANALIVELRKVC
jgi:hypothetical protein